jgi:DNA-binding transcriptional LysR family regulator
MHFRMTSWDDLRIFLSVARSGSASAAAPGLGLSQPTVSRRLAALARSLGAELVQAGARGYELTPAGRSLQAHAEAMEREVLSARRDLDRLDERPRGSVRLSAPEGLGLALLAPALGAFARQHPGIDLVLAAESAVANLSRREADLALRFVRPRQRDLVMRRLASVPFSPYASPRYLKEHPREAGASLLPGDDLVALHESMDASPEGSWLQAHAPRQRVRVRVHASLALREALLAGAGVGILPDYLGEHPGLRRIGSGPILHRDLFLVFHRALRNAERLRIVSRFVLECLEGRGARQAGRGPGG